MKELRKSKIACSLVGMLIVGLLISGCIPVASAQEKITVVVPPWGSFPKDLLGEFEKDTGIKVNLVSKGWEPLYDSIVIGCAAGTPPGDVLEFDWSWTGEFGATDWFVPLTARIPQEIQDKMPSIKSFVYKGDILAVPYNNDFRVIGCNMKKLKQIGYDSPPGSLREVRAVSLALKAMKIDEYPLVYHLSQFNLTNAATGWFLLALAYGQGLFDEKMNPLFEEPNSAGAKALHYVTDSVRKYKIISPVLLETRDVGVYFRSGKGTILLSPMGPNVRELLDPELSKISDAFQIGLFPGAEGIKSATFSLVEGLAIPRDSEHKESAWKFIHWLIQPQTQNKMFLSMGLFPARIETINELSVSGQLPFGDILAEQQKYIEPLFPAGCPTWFAELQLEAGNMVYRTSQGQITVKDALANLAEKVEKWRKE